MRTPRFPDSQILAIIKQNENGVAVQDICREHGMTFYNHKRVYRIYRELELNLRIKPRRGIKRERPDTLSVPTTINQVWSMDFMSDSLANGSKLRTFNVMDGYNREGLAIEVDRSLPSKRVIWALEQAIEWRGKPAALRCDSGPEYISGEMMDWANQNKITLLYIQ